MIPKRSLIGPEKLRTHYGMPEFCHYSVCGHLEDKGRHYKRYNDSKNKLPGLSDFAVFMACGGTICVHAATTNGDITKLSEETLKPLKTGTGTAQDWKWSRKLLLHHNDMATTTMHNHSGSHNSAPMAT